MSKTKRRYERALAALRTIARSMGNVVFRVEDYRPPLVTKRGVDRDEPREQSGKPSDTKRAGQNR